MTQIFLDDGKFIPVTIVSVEPSTVIRIKTIEKDGYNAIVLAYDNKNKIGKSILGLFKNFGKFRYIKEFRTDDIKDLKPGDKIGLNSFSQGDKIKVTSYSKGKGFQGVVKRHGFRGASATHGTKDQLRMPGSIGATESARVFRGVRMPGRMGGEKVTIDNLEIVKIESEKNLIYIKGAISGGSNALVVIKGKGDIKLYEEPKSKVEKNEETINDINVKIAVAEDKDAEIPEVVGKEEIVIEDVLPEAPEISEVIEDKKEKILDDNKENKNDSEDKSLKPKI